MGTTETVTCYETHLRTSSPRVGTGKWLQKN